MNHLMERQDGYYWIRLNPYFHGQWVIAYYRKSAYPKKYRDHLISHDPKNPDAYDGVFMIIKNWIKEDEKSFLDFIKKS